MVCRVIGCREAGSGLELSLRRYPQKIRYPNRRNSWIRIAGRLHWVKERAVGIEQPVLDHERDFILPLGQVEAVLDFIPDQIKARQPGEDILPCAAERVIVIPECGGLLIVRIRISSRGEERTCSGKSVREPGLRVSIAFRQNPGAVQVYHGADSGSRRFRTVDRRIY